MKEWLLITTSFILIFSIIFLGSYFFKKYLINKIKPTTRLLISFIWFVAVIILFSINPGRDNFTLIQQITFFAFAVGYLIYLYFRYKKLTTKDT